MADNYSNTRGSSVSVIIPTYNSSAFIEACIRSVKRQSHPIREILIVDNFSTDSTVDIANRLGVRVLIKAGEPKNPGSSRNVGLLNSSGDYVLFLDSDEVLEEKVVEECVELCEEGGVGMVKIPILFYGKGFWSASSAFWRNCHYAVSRRTIGNFPRFFWKECLTVIPYNENVRWGEDWALYMRMKSLGVKEAYCVSCMIHVEPSSLNKMVLKNLYYGREIPNFSYNVRNDIYLILVRNAYLAFKEALNNLPRPTSLLIGAFLIVCFKLVVTAIGLFQSEHPGG